MNSSTVKLTQDLVRCESFTPNDAGCQKIIGERLAAIGFNLESVTIEEVTNLWAFRPADKANNKSGLLCFAGHTDVVPTGPLREWAHPPFSAEIIDGVLHGRGTADMKGGLAAMVTAVETLVESKIILEHDLAFLITSDEEGPSIHGTKAMMDWLKKRDIRIDWCIIGEPSSSKKIGDVIRIGRRGSLTGYLSIKGTQGHVAYPQLADNAISRSLQVLQEIDAIEWDTGSEHFPSSTLQIAQVHAGEVDNVIPGELTANFNLRYNDKHSDETIKRRIEDILKSSDIEYEINWHHSGAPFLTQADSPLIQASVKAIKNIQNLEVELSTGGGTSDGRFIAPTGAHVVELGLLNHSIHKINEHVRLSELDELHALYLGVIRELFTRI
jgi:succinyl-diaminopimelate desuccinylase